MVTTQKDIEKRILITLYEGRFLSDNDADLRILFQQEQWNDSLQLRAMNRLEGEALIEPGGAGYQITPVGILSAEQDSTISEELSTANKRARIRMLERLAGNFDKQESSGGIHYNTLSTELELDEKIVLDNLWLLDELGSVVESEVGSYDITFAGLDTVDEYRKRRGLAEEFEEISKLEPQPRGRALQKLLAKLLEQHGWSQLEAARTSNEEMDIIISKQREYYLIECKWEKNPCQAEVIRELFGKLGNRVDVRGIAMSMSGYTSGAVEQVEDYVNSKIILLFGPEDVRSMVYQDSMFEDLLNQKYRELVIRKKVVFR